MVKNIDDIINNWDSDNQPRRKRSGWLKQALFIVLVIAVAYLAYRQFSQTRETDTAVPLAGASSADQGEARVRGMLAQGEYDAAYREIRRHHLASLSAELQDELSIRFYFKYDLPEPAQMHSDRLQLPIKTRYYALIDVDEGCYLYFLQHNTAGEWRQIYPPDRWTNPEQITQRGELEIPKTGRLINETGPGTETLYVCASRWRQEKLEKLIADAEDGGRGSSALSGYIRMSLDAKLKYPGIVCKTIAFDHQ